ncbi:MAG TPA: Lrp/AsnC family transcriptional regulator [Ktedonobacterales bacterium]|jgi:Lrp/AsnC family transcriptional regulator, leucine-responsive regulatory protein|nr:Lrp/AsnC family transcriptional regulator [Ktedonobacterales bacterium]
MNDDIDREIVKIIQTDARISVAEIARHLGMAPSGILERIRKLEVRGVIRGYEARLDPQALGRGLLAFVFVRADERVGSGVTGEQLAAIPDVQEVHHIAGEDCYLVKVRVENTEALARLLRDRFGALDAVRSTRTTIVLTTLKETATLPVPIPEEDIRE